ncbi:hypothetical protein KP509_39G059100 [Ceratopteris richardii]|uniref:Hexosyltransferase n=3 Tax=Ceratopteris richardii TaxID=49495 RepID=A0A8T2Q1Q9_CERRI|nr:hypothetical protein KP509_39G059100 [Ceratopteris richardii]KAH7277610.1 hypothetical protein KP509_39G059100 [Ceratopteris richardii]KAH7277611.1 hypothetical protein KP509_39G059100 [Ceratopteris richardii]KAH7277614.1 hypothetical protein KP509_39G059100 [Ceratopteris richardii]
MQVHISHSMNRITISTSNGFLDFAKVKVAARHLSYRNIFYSMLVLAFLLPFIFIITALMTLENVGKCSTINCLGRKWGPAFPPFDSSLRDSKRILSLLSQVAAETVPKEMNIPESFEDLIAEVGAKNLGTRTSILKLRAMVEALDKQVKETKLQEALYKHFASTGIPKGLHCLSLKLTTEYTSNAKARQELPSPELVPRLSDNSFYHYIMASDNVLAASVVVSSTVKNAKEPWKIVFHVITDRKTYAAMHAWFALYPLSPAIIEVKGVHQFSWLTKDHVPVLEALETHNNILWYYHGDLGVGTNLSDSPRLLASKLQARSPKYISILNHLRIYLPELFPDLKKVIFLDDDVVVQRDLSPLWSIDMKGNVNGAVETCRGEDTWVMSKTFKTYFDFSNPLIANNFDSKKCAWAYGMNIFDLEAWRNSQITKVYHHWVKQNINANLTLWRLGTLPPSLIAFDGHVHPIDPLWHMLGLGYQPKTDIESVKQAAVIHYNGQAKPWLDIAFPELKPFWTKYVDYSNEFIRHCNILES